MLLDTEGIGKCFEQNYPTANDNSKGLIELLAN